MRKRIVIGVSAVFVLVVVLLTVSESRNGSMEYHKQQIAQLSELGGKPWWKSVLHDIVRPNYQKREKQISWHMEKLRELGFWEERGYLFTNRALTPQLVGPDATALIQNASAMGTPFYYYVWWIETNGSRSNIFSVRVPQTDIAKWDELVRKTDVP